jgi:Flp pilus assembly protein TadD
LDPESLAALLNRSENLTYFDRYGDAAEDLRAAARVAPNVALVWSNLGSIYYRIGRLRDAAAAYETALEIEPNAARTRAAYADCLRRRGEAEAAVRELERARTDAAGDDDLQMEIAFKLGTIHEHERRYGDAVREYEASIRHGERAGESGTKARSRIEHILAYAFEDR